MTVICRHSCPRVLLSDSGAFFRSNLVTEIVRNLGVRTVYCSSYRPQTNGLTESYNGVLGTALAMFVNSKHDDWDEYVKLCTFSYNVSIHATTKYTPFYLLYGREPTLPIDAGLQPDLQIGVATEERLARLREARSLVLDVIKQEQERQKRYHDAGHRHVDYLHVASPPFFLNVIFLHL
jgi:transposase InsO family protein